MRYEYIDTFHVATATARHLGGLRYHVTAQLNGTEVAGEYHHLLGNTTNSANVSQLYVSGKLADLAREAQRSNALDPTMRLPR